MTTPHDGATARLPAVLVTGASSGIGKAAAQALAASGCEVFAGYRKAGDAAALAALDPRVRPVCLDITDARAIADAVAEIEAALEGGRADARPAMGPGARGLKALVNNAGVPHGGPVELMPLDELRRVFEINVIAQIAVTQAFMPLLRRTPGARVVNVTSISGRVAAPFAGAYAGSKHALEALTESLRHELRPFGMWASAIEPGVFKSGLWTKGEATATASREVIARRGEAWYGASFDRYMQRFAKNEAHAPDPAPVARAIVRAVHASRPKRRYVVGADARAGVVARWLLPEPVFEWILRKGSGRR